MSRLFPILALAVALLVLFFYVRPTWNGSIREAKAAIAFNEQALAAAAEYAAQQDALARARAAMDPANLARLQTFLPDSVDNVGLILDLNGLAARSGLSLSNIDVIVDESGASAQTVLPTAPSPVGSVSLTLSALGSYSALQSFLKGLERSARLLDVQDLVVKGSDTGVYTYQITMKLYWLR